MHTKTSQKQTIQVAIKELDNEESFERERKNLAAIQDLNNPHLIRHIATCQRDNVYYVVFPLANGGDLRSYWKQKNTSPRDHKLILWSLQQMRGLASATHDLHYGLGDSNCRHGDLKPANILYFEKDGDDSLVIADLGVSRIHEINTNLRTQKTETKATTRAYEAPEVEDHEKKKLPRSRTYDIWSLGCVYLEFVIWLLYNSDAIRSFEDQRNHPRNNPESSFYELQDEKAVLLGSVLEAIGELLQHPKVRGGTALEALVQMIKDKLLVIDVKDRFNAKQLQRELEGIVRDAEQGSLELVKEVRPPSSCPKTFLSATRRISQ